MQKSPPPQAPPPKGPPATMLPPPGLAVDPMNDLGNRISALEQKVDSILEILQQQAADRNRDLSSIVPAITNLPLTMPARPRDRGPIQEAWDWHWGQYPAVSGFETYHRCWYNNKNGHCPPGTAATWYVRWVPSSKKGRFWFLCEDCAIYWRDDDKLEGFLAVRQ